MKWTYLIQRKLRAMCLLAGIMLVIILGTVLSQHNVEGIDHSSASIYNDRLIPATTIIYITENLYSKRLSLENHLFSSSAGLSAGVENQLKAYDKSIDSLLRLFEKTYLVEEEAKSLAAFKDQNNRYVLLESRILALCSAGNVDEGKRIFAQQGALKFREAVTSLNELTDIQSNVGKDLMKESKSNMASFGVITSLQLGLAVVIGLMILALIYESRIVEKPVLKDKSQYFNLN
ncbi:MCP four helix bundle domain-containing protein [Dyadobacter crusticola]|uniref:MCP four helix bundle domain-containing protein n=1 Tax=Dyadobacter crusticola TaxID=292407 RepID=UPI0004E270F9|nr:MCP four helix bundle domain-containing protein [Dyadobacter crusticola]